MTPIDKCDKNEVARFVQQNFIYACNSKPGSLFADSADCLLSTINSKQECLMLLKKTDDDRADGCSQLSDFFKCIHDDVQKACKARGVAALVHGIDRFGCDVGKLDASKRDHSKMMTFSNKGLSFQESELKTRLYQIACPRIGRL